MDAASAKSAVTNGGGDGGGVAPLPAPMPAANAPPPFLVKTYDMVDDPSTNKIVSWGPNNNTFVVWDSAEFSKDLLPKYFKHNNFSSFVRQLNTYGFKKVDPDRWEFANEGFLRGQKHLLKGISRRKPVHGQHPLPNHHQPPANGQTSAGPCVEVGKFGLEEEVEQLKRDKNVLMQELVRLRQQQQTTDGQLQTMVQRLQGMEQRQQQMMSFLAKAVNSPGFLAHFMQQQPADAGARRITEGSKKRRLKQDDDGDGSSPVGPADGQIVKYQPLMNEAAKSMLRQIMKLDSSSPWLEDGQPEVAAGSGGLTLQEVAPLAEIPEVCSSPATGALPSASDSLLTDLSQMVAPNGDIVVGPAVDGMPFDIGGLSPEPQMDWDAGNLLDEIPELPGVSDPFWEKFLESPVGLEVELGSTVTPAEDAAEADVMRPLEENGWDKKQHMAHLTEQMGLLSSDAEKV